MHHENIRREKKWEEETHDLGCTRLSTVEFGGSHRPCQWLDESHGGVMLTLVVLWEGEKGGGSFVLPTVHKDLVVYCELLSGVCYHG